MKEKSRMLEKRAGRLKWEQADQGVRVVIPARWGWLAVIAVAGLTPTDITVWWLERTTAPDEVSFKLGLLCAVTLAVGVCAAMVWILWGCTGRTMVTVNPHEIIIQRRIAGVEWDTRRFATSDVRGLRYIPPAEMWAFRTDTDPNTSKIQFQAKKKTIRFARGITEREACALFDRMQEIYNSSKTASSIKSR